MLRAIRLVVDTGLHYKRWTREQVVQFFHDHSAIDEVDGAERDRPLHRLARPRRSATRSASSRSWSCASGRKRSWASKFDIRQFHDEVLGAGALPMDILEARIDNWIQAKKG